MILGLPPSRLKDIVDFTTHTGNLLTESIYNRLRVTKIYPGHNEHKVLELCKH